MAESVHVLTPPYYERLAALEQRHWWWRGGRRIVQRLLAGIDPGRRAIDAGCGTGLMISWLDRELRITAMGLDRSTDALRFCRGRGCTRVVEGDAAALPFATGSAGLTLSLDVIQHLPRPGGDRAAIAELARVLAPGGHLLLRTNSACGYPPVEAHDYHRYRREEVRSLLDEAGLACERLTYVNVLPALAITTLRKVRRSVPHGDPGLPDPARSPGLTSAACYACLAAEAELVRWLRVSLPFGHSIVALARKPAPAPCSARTGALH